MERRKMIGVFLVASMVLLGGYALANRNGNDVAIDPIKKGGLFSDDNAALVDQSTEINDSWESLFGTIAGGTGSSDDAGNVTKSVARAAFDQMKALDQQGKSPFDETNINAAEMQSAIEGSVSGSIDSFFADILVTNSDIKVSTNNTRSAKIAYLKAFEEALARHPAKEEYKNISGGLQGQIDAVCLNGEVGVMDDVAVFYADIAKDVATVRVPSGWIDFQKQTIIHYKQGSLVFASIARCNTDPLKGIAAVQRLPKFGMDAFTLQNTLKKMYNEVGL